MNDRVRRALGSLGKLETTNEAGKGGQAAMHPTYCPWSQAEYMKRAASFHWTWASRPAPADVITAARHGWRGASVDLEDDCTIICTACRARLVLPWSEELLPEAAQAMAQEYGALIAGRGHGNSGCPWSAVRPCAKEIGMAQYATVPLEEELLRQRALSFSRVRINSPPPIREACEPSIFGDGDAINMLALIVGKEVSRGALLLAAMQWQVSQGAILCRFNCCSEVPLAAQDIMHPVETHAWYCPFIQSGGLEGFLALWEGRLGVDLQRIEARHPLLSRFTSRQVKELIKGR